MKFFVINMAVQGDGALPFDDEIEAESLKAALAVVGTILRSEGDFEKPLTVVHFDIMNAEGEITQHMVEVTR